FTGFEVASLDRKLCLVIQLLVPLAERVSEPGHLWSELRQAQLFPAFLPVLHVLALWEGDRWKRLFENRVAQHRRFVRRQMIGDHIGPLLFVMVQERRRMAFFPAAADVHLFMRFYAIAHGPENRRLI